MPSEIGGGFPFVSYSETDEFFRAAAHSLNVSAILILHNAGTTDFTVFNRAKKIQTSFRLMSDGEWGATVNRIDDNGDPTELPVVCGVPDPVTYCQAVRNRSNVVFGSIHRALKPVLKL